ncbi:MAG: AAA family ATPase [Micromonospora sp.]
MATLFLTCGVQGAGKTTLARRLEQRYGALRLTADEWLHDLGYPATGAELDAYRDGVERVQWRTALRVLELGCAGWPAATRICRPERSASSTPN